MYKCAYCLKGGVKLTRDHITPKSRGGTSSWANLVPACTECNNKKGNRPIWEILQWEDDGGSSAV